jgi:glyoxylase-like metal-dependent hydrolase (beta-lactamase superfamily II)
VLANRAVAPEHNLLTVATRDIGRRARAGQFAQIRVPGGAVFLPRPFSFLAADADRCTFLSRAIGPGTRALAGLAEGTELDLMGPLGSGFDLPAAATGEVILVGGGVGVPPLVHAAAELAPLTGTALIGAARADFLLCEREFADLGWQVRLATDDGSRGHHGFVTELLQQQLASASAHNELPVTVLACGPHAMLHRCAELSAAGVTMADVRAVLLTHIHLDHAGVTGTLVRENPALQVYVHELGAPHMVAPERLMSSAARLYGADMDRLWGEFLPVPEANIRVLRGGEQIEAGGRGFDVAYTPGHASHHVSYFDPASGVAFVGDTAGVRTGQALFVMPPTPPPDIDVEVWTESIELIRRWRPATLFATHFGPHEDAAAHLDALLQHLAALAELARQTAGGGTLQMSGLLVGLCALSRNLASPYRIGQSVFTTYGYPGRNMISFVNAFLRFPTFLPLVPSTD